MKRLLYISHRVPYPPDKGERCRAFHEVRALSRAFRVTLASLAHRPADLEAAERMRRWCDEVVAVPAGGKLGLARGAMSLLAGRSVTQGYFHSRALYRALRRRGRFDVVVAYSSSMLPYALAVPATSHVADLVDVYSEKWAAYARAAEPPKRWLYALEARGVRRLERRALDCCDAVVLVTQAEADALPARNGTVHAIANGVDAEYFSPSPRPDRPARGLVFTGTMDYRPNVEGVCWFARDVWPHLRRSRPDLTFTIVGRDPTRQVRELAEREGIEVTGTVPDVRPYLAAADVVVAPLRIARGIQTKVLEAMAMAKAVVASPAALAGLDVEWGRDVVAAERPEEWIARVGELLAGDTLRRQIEERARQCVLSRYRWEARLAPFVSLCEAVSGRPCPAVERRKGRILYHHRTQGAGVEGVHVRGMVKAFRDLGWEVDVLGPPGVAVEGSGAPAAPGPGGGLLRRALRRFAAAAPETVFELGELCYNAWAGVRLLRALSRRRYDMVYERYALFLAAGVAAAKLRGVPIVLEVNDSTRIERSRPLRLRYLADVVERWILRGACRIVTVSRPFKRRLLAHGLEADRVLVTPNAVDPADWPARAAGSGPAAGGGCVVIGCVAAFVDWHRPDLLIRCAARIAGQADVRLLLIGDGPARPRAEALAGELGLAERVTFTGFVPHETVRRLLSEVDVAVVPHSNAHGSPMKVLEYMAAGKAVVAPACEPICEVVRDGETGLLFEPLDADSLAGALLRLVRDPQLRRRLGEGARRHVLASHTWTKNAEAVLGHLPAAPPRPARAAIATACAAGALP